LAGDADAEEKKEERKPRREEKVVEEEKYVEEIVGVSLDDFLKTKTTAPGKKLAREAEGVKNAKVEADGLAKDKVETKIQNQYLKQSLAKVADSSAVNLGF